LIRPAKQNSQQDMNSEKNGDEAKIIDLDPESVTDHDAATSKRPEHVRSRWQDMAAAAGRPLLAAVALVAAALAGGWIYRDVLWRYIPNDQVSTLAGKADALVAENAVLKDRVVAFERLAEQLKSDIDALESAQASVSTAAKSAGDSAASLSQRVDTLAVAAQASENKLSTLAADVQRLRAAGTSGAAGGLADVRVLERLDTLEKDVASLKAGNVDGAATTALLLSRSMADLKAKVAAGTPFVEELERVTRLVPAAPGLAELAPYARAGLQDAKSLATELASLATSLPVPGELQPVRPGNDGWVAWTLEQLSDLVSIRVAGDGDWKLTAEKAAALAETGELGRAVALLKDADGIRPPGIDQWIERAEGRVAADAHVKSIEEAVLRAIAAKG
jgi:hypothetical protein